MTPRKRFSLTVVALCFTAVLILAGCNKGGGRSAGNSERGGANSESATDPAETGVEKAKPAPGTGNVQGKVLFNSKPVENIEVKLCEKFTASLAVAAGRPIPRAQIETASI